MVQSRSQKYLIEVQLIWDSGSNPPSGVGENGLSHLKSRPWQNKQIITHAPHRRQSFYPTVPSLEEPRENETLNKPRKSK